MRDDFVCTPVRPRTKSNVDPTMHLYGYLDEVLRGPSPFTIAERELIAAYVSTLNDCSYCSRLHDAIAIQLGIAEDTLDSLLLDVDGAIVDVAMKPIFKYIHKLTDHTSRITSEDAAKVYTAGWNSQALDDAVTISQLFVYLNSSMRGMHSPLYKTYIQSVSSHLAINGYADTLHRLGVRGMPY